MQDALEKNLCASASAFLTTLAHPTRLAILCRLVEVPNGACVSELVEYVGIGQPVVSQFLARMSEEGLVRAKRQGRKMFYEVTDARVHHVLNNLREVFCSPLPQKSNRRSPLNGKRPKTK